MKVSSLEWDSDFFKKRIGELQFPLKTQVANSKEYDLLYVKDHPSEGPEIPGFKKTYEETRVVFSKKILDIPPSDPNIVSGIKHFFPDKSQIYALAYLSGQESRFKLDPGFTEVEFKKLYRTWIDNSLSGKLAEDIFIYQSDGRSCGLITYSSSGKVAKIGLFAVSPEDQGRGMGTKLMNRVVQAIGSTERELVIETQAHNKMACSFYCGYGFEIMKRKSLKHFWRNDSL